MALNGLFCADVLRPLYLVPLTDFTYKYHLPAVCNDIQLTEVGGAEVVNDVVVRSLLHARSTRHFVTCTHRYIIINTGKTTLPIPALSDIVIGISFWLDI